MKVESQLNGSEGGGSGYIRKKQSTNLHDFVFIGTVALKKRIMLRLYLDKL